MDRELSSLSRRDLLKSSSALALMIATGGCDKILDDIKNRPTRRNISNLAANDPIIQSYKDAITQMKALPTSDARNWTRQAQIHNDHCPHGNWYFLPWHRAYLLYFERICRKLSGNNSFALPYWNWTVESKVPDVFWGGAGNPMFDGTRLIAQGTPLDQGFVGHSVLEGILQEPNFLLFGSSQAVGQRDRTGTGLLEGTPHNYVHGAISGDMGNYMSPLDPIFWTHHNMIEYCWVDWNLNRHHDNTNDQGWYNFNLVDFFDENGSATSLKIAITMLFPIFDYQYEPSQIGQAMNQLHINSKKEADVLKQFVQTGANVDIAVLQRFPLEQATEVQVGKVMTRSIPLEAAPVRTALNGGDQRLLLKIDDVQQPKQSDFFVRVFLNLPDASPATPISDPHYAGSFAFFLGDHGAHAEGSSAKPGFVVDVTQALRRLSGAGATGNLDKVDVQLVAVPFPGRQVAATSFSLQRMELATSRITSK